MFLMTLCPSVSRPSVLTLSIRHQLIFSLLSQSLKNFAYFCRILGEIEKVYSKKYIN